MTRDNNNVQPKVNILIVDDDPAKLLAVESILAELGENLVKAALGREALTYLLHQDVKLYENIRWTCEIEDKWQLATHLTWTFA
jgi:CheY-like chemotaxis protein